MNKIKHLILRLCSTWEALFERMAKCLKWTSWWVFSAVLY